MILPVDRLGWLYGLLAVPVVLLPGVRPRALGGAGLALIGLAAGASAAASGGEPTRGFVAVNAILVLAGLTAVGAAVFLAWRHGGSAVRDSLAAGQTASPSFDPFTLAGAVIVLLASQVIVLGLGAALSLVSATRSAVRSRRTLGLFPLLAAAVALGAGLGFLLTLMGPLGGGLQNLAQGPISPAAERLLVLLIGGAALLLSGVAPLDRLAWGLALAPLAAVLLCRLVVPPFPEGLLVWQATFMVLLAVACSWAAFAGRWCQVAVAGGMFAIWTGSRDGIWAGAVLVTWGWLVETGVAIAWRGGVIRNPRWLGLLVLPAALAALPALRAGLRAQVMLSTLAVAGCAAALLRVGLRGPWRQHAPLY